MAKRAEFLECGDTGDTIKLIPMTAIQMLDIGISNSRLDEAKREKPLYRAVSGESGAAADIHISTIECNKAGNWYDTSDPKWEPENNEVKSIQANNKIQFQHIVDVFAGKWLPLPYFKREITDKFEFNKDKIGPTNWVRARLIKLDEEGKEDNSYHLVIAVDTRIGIAPKNTGPAAQSRKYLMPTDMDIATGGAMRPNIFSLCGEEQLLDYIKEDWVQKWIDNCFDEYCRNHPQERKYRFKTESERWIKGRMLYLALIQHLCTRTTEDGAENTGIAPNICLVQTGDMSTAERIEVDLVLDIGHSRTCGFLLDNKDSGNNFKGEPLELRDLSKPNMIDDQVFESCLEFAIADFGDKKLSRDSGRRFPVPAFSWPSICRVGSEARRMSCQPGSRFGETGFINPKRYLWDKELRPHAWSFFSSRPDQEDTKINADKDTGFCDVLDKFGNYNNDRTDPVLQAKYPRSAMTFFFLSEIINQAISQINSASYRLKKQSPNTPRVLHNIVLTVPSAFSAEEIDLLKRRANDAVNIIWHLLGWSDESDSQLTQFIHKKPEVLVHWDEATCTQATYLYAEIAHKFYGRKKEFLELLGKPRPFPDNQTKNKKKKVESIRVASLDIGGGSTDLSITTFGLLPESELLKTQFDFREGFDFAGNQVLKAVIEKVVLPGLICCLKKADLKIKDAEKHMRALFQKNLAGQTEDNKRGRNAFGKQICQQVALYALAQHEQDPDMEKKLLLHKLSDILKYEESPSKTALNYLNPIFGEDDTDKEDREEESKLLNLQIPLDMEALIGAVEDALQPTIAQLCEVIFQYQVDILLVSGGLSRFPVVRKLLSNRMPVDINRIEFMHGYRVGDWYPYRDAKDVINEPKTTVVIGAAILNMARGELTNFSLRVEGFRFGTMIRHIGFMDNNNTIYQTLFKSSSDEKNPPFNDSEETEEVIITEEKPIGFQQFHLKRWPVSPFYYIRFKDKGIAKKFPDGVKVTLSLEPAEEPESNSAQGEANIPIGYKLRIEDSEPVNDENSDFEDEDIDNLINLSPCSVTRDSEENENCFKFAEVPELAEKYE